MAQACSTTAWADLWPQADEGGKGFTDGRAMVCKAVTSTQSRCSYGAASNLVGLVASCIGTGSCHGIHELCRMQSHGCAARRRERASFISRPYIKNIDKSVQVLIRCCSFAEALKRLYPPRGLCRVLLRLAVPWQSLPTGSNKQTATTSHEFYPAAYLAPSTTWCGRRPA